MKIAWRFSFKFLKDFSLIESGELAPDLPAPKKEEEIDVDIDFRDHFYKSCGQ